MTSPVIWNGTKALNLALDGFKTANGGTFQSYLTKAQAKAATPSGSTMCFIEENYALYMYCDDCNFTADDDLVLTTANGGSTRWEMVQKLSRGFGDTGWINTDNAVITKQSSTSVRLAIGSEAAIGIKGVRYPLPIANYDCTISGSAGTKFVGFDGPDLVLKQKDVLWDFDSEVPVMTVDWNGTAIVGQPTTEFHGMRPTIWHQIQHNYVGLLYKSGLIFTGSEQTDNNTNPGADDTVFYLWATSGVVADEDAESTPGTGRWAQTLGSGLTSDTAGIFPFLYYNGSLAVGIDAMADRAPFIHAGANTPPQWNNNGVMTASVTNDYIVYHYFATPRVGGWSIFGRPHNAKYTSLALAQTASPSDLTWQGQAEIKHIYTAIFRVNTGWSNTHRCKLVSLRSFRLTPGSPSAGISATDHNAMSNRGVDNCHPGQAISLDTTTFTSILSSTDDDTQAAIGTLRTFLANMYTPATMLSSPLTLTSLPRIVSVQANTATINLPQISTVPKGGMVTIHNQTGSTITIVPYNGDYVDGVSYVSGGIQGPTAYGADITLVNNGVNDWYSVAKDDVSETMASAGNIGFARKNIRITNGSDGTYVLPSLSLSQGTTITITVVGAGIATIDADTGNTIDGFRTYVMRQYETINILAISSTQWRITNKYHATMPRESSYVSAATATTLVANSPELIRISSPSSQINQDMPTTNVYAGRLFTVIVNGATTTNYVKIRSSGGNDIEVIAGDGFCTLIALQDSPTAAAHWKVLDIEERYVNAAISLSCGTGPSNNTGKTITFYRRNKHASCIASGLLMTTGSGASASMLTDNDSIPSRIRPATYVWGGYSPATENNSILSVMGYLILDPVNGRLEFRKSDTSLWASSTANTGPQYAQATWTIA